MSSPQSQIHLVTVGAEQAGQRLDKWLAALEFMPSRVRAVELIELGLVTAGGRRLKPAQRIPVGTEVQIEIPVTVPVAGLQPLDRELDILFEDEDLVVVNKPAGLVVHPSAGHAQDTLVNILLHHVDNLSMGFGENRPGIVHRLDRDTSGILAVAKNDISHRALAAQFKSKTAHRLYWALVHGLPPQKKTVRSYLARHPKDRKRFASHPAEKGKIAITHFELRETLQGKVSWLECKLETGRTHQIRVHSSESGHPILGDPLYGSSNRDRGLPVKVSGIPRLALHACELGLTHPRTGEALFFKQNWPTDLAQLVRELGFKNVSA